MDAKHDFVDGLRREAMTLATLQAESVAREMKGIYLPTAVTKELSRSASAGKDLVESAARLTFYEYLLAAVKGTAGGGILHLCALRYIGGTARHDGSRNA
jgi:hypothetical protein